VRLARSRCPSRPCVGQRFGTGVVDTSLESCDTSRRFGIFATARCQYRLINGVRTFSGRVPYLESNEHDNPTGQPVSMADLGESIHESSGPSRNCPELRIHLATGARTGRERGDHRASVSHDRRSVQALLCQPSASGSHFPERAIYPTDIVACHLLSAQPERRGEVCWQLHVCELHALQRRREIVAFDGAA
jgi:hypothetical protein